MRFVCDIMLGRLARYLRMFGFDAAYGTVPPNPDTTSFPDDPPYLLTRRVTTPDRVGIIRIRSDKVREQLLELKDALHLSLDGDLMLSRCLDCNAPLRETPKEEVEGQVPEYVFHRNRRFKRCPSCGKVYWAGTHAEDMSRCAREVFGP